MDKKRKRGAVILAGGESRRMGRPKAWLPFGDQTLLERVLNVVATRTDFQVVVSAANQPVPPIPPNVRLATDRHPARGPLEGLRAGLEAGRGEAELFFVCSCDVPLLRPEVVDFLFQALADDDQIVVPRDDRHFHPLAAVYRADVLSTVERLLADDQLRPVYLFEHVQTRVVPVSSLREVDPQLDSFRNLNTPDDYAAALRDAGLA